MKKKSFSRHVLGFLASAIWLSAVAPANATAILDKTGAVAWQAGIDGVEVEWAADGRVKRIYSRVVQTVEFGDRRGINSGYKIAELKAKAAIVKFLKQSVSSTEKVEEIQSELNKAIQTKSSNSAAGVQKIDERTFSSSFKETVTAYANGELSGVIVLERGYSEKDSEVWVTVGLSDKTRRAAAEVSSFINKDSNVSDSNKDSQKSTIKKVSSEISRSKNIENF